MIDKKEKISKHISYATATYNPLLSNSGIDNVPTKADLDRMRTVAEKVFEPLRNYMGVPIRVTLFYISKAVNDKIGGSETSQHLTGEAMKLDAKVFGVTNNTEIFYYLLNNVDFDQLIWELGDNDEPLFVHVSYNTAGKQRGEVLQSFRDENEIIRYKKWTSHGKPEYKKMSKMQRQKNIKRQVIIELQKRLAGNLFRNAWIIQKVGYNYVTLLDTIDPVSEEKVDILDFYDWYADDIIWNV